MEHARSAHVIPEQVVSVTAQEAVPREFYCRGVRLIEGTGMWSRCGNHSKYYVFVDEADEPRQAVCGVCKNKAKRGRLKVLR